jgi:hypothetical protein
MAETTLEEAMALLDLAETMAWCQRVGATVRFYTDAHGSWVRMAAHTDPGDREVITHSVQPVVDDSAHSLAKALTDGGVDIVAQVQRTSLTVVR